MATTLTPNIKLRVNSNLTADAVYNLYQIDTLGLTYVVDSSGDVRIRASQNIVLQPEDSSIGGTGGGSIDLASRAAPADSINLFASNINLGGTLSLKDEAPTATGFLELSYDSTTGGNPVAAGDLGLTIGLAGEGRSLVLGVDLSVVSPTVGQSLTLALPLGSSSLSLPVSGTVATTAGAETFTNKTLDGSLNTIFNLPGSALASNAMIPYSKLVLTNSIVNSDISSVAAITYPKLSLSNSIVDSDIRSSAAISYSKLALGGSIQNSDVSGSAGIEYGKLDLVGQIQNTDIESFAGIDRSKLGTSNPGWVVINDGSGQFSAEPQLDRTRGGTGVASSANFPTSGNVTTDVNVQTFQNKTIDGNLNTYVNIPYSGVNLANQIKNSDISPTAGIIYSKLALTNSIVDEDINSSANIAGTKILPDFGGQQIVTSGGIRLLEAPFHIDIFTNPAQNVDYNLTLPVDPGANGQVLITDGAGTLSWSTISGTGTVTSVGFSAPNSVFNVNGAPITTAGTIALSFVDQPANTVLAGPTSGADASPDFRSLVVTDLPTGIPAVNIGSGSVDNTEFDYLDGVTSSIQTQFAGKQPLDGDLTAIAGLFSTGIAVRTAANTWTTRALTAGTAISIANGDGVASSPVISNTSPDQVVVLTPGAGISVTGTYPTFTLASTITQYTNNDAIAAVAGALVDSGDIDFTYSAGVPSITATLTPTLVIAGSYGDASHVATIAVTAAGRVDGANSVAIAIPSTQVTDFVEAAQDAVGGILTDTSSIDLTYNDAGGTITADVTPGTMTSKAVPIGADLVVIGDSAAGNVVKSATVSSIVALATAKSFKTNWLTADGLTKVVTHNLGSVDLLVQLVDVSTGETIYVNSVVRTTTNVLTLTSSQAPSISWRVLILEV